MSYDKPYEREPGVIYRSILGSYSEPPDIRSIICDDCDIELLMSVPRDGSHKRSIWDFLLPGNSGKLEDTTDSA